MSDANAPPNTIAFGNVYETELHVYKEAADKAGLNLEESLPVPALPNCVGFTLQRGDGAQMKIFWDSMDAHLPILKESHSDYIPNNLKKRWVLFGTHIER